MPHTVPNRPTNGAVEPTEASSVRPRSSRADTRLISRRKVRVINSPGSVAALSDGVLCCLEEILAASAACNASGVYICSLSTACIAVVASLNVGALQKPSSALLLRRMRQELQVLDRM